MNSFLVYIVEVNLYIALFAIAYYFLLSRETAHRANRWVILASPLLAFIIPSLVLQSTGEAAQLIITLDPILITTKTSIAHTPAGYNIPTFISILYSLGFLVCTILAISRFRTLNHYLKSGTATVKGGIRYVQNSAIQAPASIFKTIFISDTIPTDVREYIVAHELVHIRERHSIDLIFMQVVQLFCWFNPAVYFLKKALEANHEFRADEVVVTRHTDRYKYAQILVGQAMNHTPQSFIHKFSKSNLLKRRIMILNQTPVRKTSLWKYLMLIPILGGAVLFNACTEKNPEAPAEVEKAAAGDSEKQSTTPPNTKKIEGTDIYTLADKMPEFPGGQEALMKFLGENIKYPEACREEGIEGRVYIGFVIDELGNVTNLEVLRSPDERLSANAMEVVAKMPQWTPGLMNSEPVKVRLNLPVFYKIKDDTGA